MINPVTPDQILLKAILDALQEILEELRALRKASAPPVSEEEDLFGEDDTTAGAPGAR